MVDLIKAVLAPEHAVIPPTIGLEKLNSNSLIAFPPNFTAAIKADKFLVDSDKLKVQVVTELAGWPSKALKGVYVNSFGFGGANACRILNHAASVVSEYRQKDLDHLIQRSTTEHKFLSPSDLNEQVHVALEAQRPSPRDIMSFVGGNLSLNKTTIGNYNSKKSSLNLKYNDIDKLQCTEELGQYP